MDSRRGVCDFYHLLGEKNMQEKKNGVKRLLNAIEQNIDEKNIEILAKLLNYHIPQLKVDIEAISLVTIENR